MNPIFSISSKNNCEMCIFGQTNEDEQYIPEDIEDALEEYYQQIKYKYSETYTLNIIQYHQTDKDEILTLLLSDHSNDDISTYKFSKDGYYTIYHLILPTIEWFKTEYEKEDSILKSDIKHYITDGLNIYLYDGSNLIQQELETIIEINTESTNISISHKDIFSICYLYKCYLDLCRKSLIDYNIKCQEENNSTSYLRDVVWMTLAAIRYLSEFQRFQEAQKLLRTVNRCNGLCNTKFNTENKLDCNCV